MEKIITYIIEYIIAFLIVYLVYRFVINKKDKKGKKKNKNSIELSLFLSLSKINEKSINKEKVMKTLSLINAFDIATVLLLTEISDNLIIKLFIAFISVFALMIASYKLYGLKFKESVK